MNIGTQGPFPGFEPKQRSGLLLHAMLASTVGFLSGFIWIMAIHGGLQFWPLPAITFDVPPSRDLLDNAHTGPIMNALFVMAVAALSSYVDLSRLQWRIAFYASVLMLWGNTIGYQAAVFAPNRGMQPEGGITNVISYFCFYFAIGGLVVTLILAIWGAIRAMRKS